MYILCWLLTSGLQMYKKQRKTTMAEGGTYPTAVENGSDDLDIVNKVTRSCTGVEADNHKSNPFKVQERVPELDNVHKQLLDMRRDKVTEVQAIAAKHAYLLKKINSLGNDSLNQPKRKLKAELGREIGSLEQDMQGDISAADKILLSTSRLTQYDITDKMRMFKTETAAQETVSEAKTLLANVASKLPLKLQLKRINDQIFEGIKMADNSYKIVSGSSQPQDKGPSKYVVNTASESSMRVDTDLFVSTIVDICQLDDGTILVIDSWNRKVKRLDRQLNVTDYCEFEDDPEGLCPVSSTEVVIRYKYSIQFIHVGTSLLPGRRIKLSITCTDFYNKIAFCGGHLWTFGDNCVCIVSTEGALVKRLDRLPDGETLFPVYDPYGIAVSNDGNRVYVTANRNQLLIFKKNGDFVKQCVDERVLEADSISVTADDIILVDCHISKKIFMFDSDGNSLGELALCADMSIGEPYAICFDKTECRLLLGFEAVNIQIYQLSKGQ